MKSLHIILLLGLAGLCAHAWNTWSEAKSLEMVTSPNGFLPVPMPPDAQQDVVLLFAPVNCPKEGAQRASALSQELTRVGIGNVRVSHFPAMTFEPTEQQKALFKRLNIVMTGEIPIALVNGMGKANPTAAELVAEFNRTKKGNASLH